MEADQLAGLVAQLQELCVSRGLWVAAAESCTGGLVASLITDRPGSSGYFRGGVVAYSDAVKEQLLGVPAEQLRLHGAVSAQVARAMAVAARECLGADVAVAVTGISGPGGGSDAKPVGLTYLACADAASVEVRRFMWSGDRAANRLAGATAALELLLERCLAIAQGVAAGAAPGAGTKVAGDPAAGASPRSTQRRAGAGPAQAG
jgi:PncC family amidohydrolase